jgi:hypothetical protein
LQPHQPRCLEGGRDSQLHIVDRRAQWFQHHRYCAWGCFRTFCY